MKIDDDFKRDLIREREEAIRFFGQQGMKERERRMFEGFLRCVPLTFNPSEINSVTEDFPDVEFRGAMFEIKEMLDAERRRQDEYKASLAKAQQVEEIRDLIEPTTADYVCFPEVASRVENFLDRYVSKYTESARASTNLLIYFNLLKTRLDKTAARDAPIPFDLRKWRSVSIVGNSWCYVFDSSSEAPEFIRANVGAFRDNPRPWE